MRLHKTDADGLETAMATLTSNDEQAVGGVSEEPEEEEEEIVANKKDFFKEAWLRHR